jgi:hypothetical protein
LRRIVRAPAILAISNTLYLQSRRLGNKAGRGTRGATLIWLPNRDRPGAVDIVVMAIGETPDRQIPGVEADDGECH